MKNKSWILTASAAVMVLVALAPAARANVISGSIDITGPITLTGGDLASATGVAFNGPATVSYVSGAYGAVSLGTQVNFSNFNWNPASTPVLLWDFNAGVWDYSFKVTSMSVVSQSSNSLKLAGGAIAYINGIGSPYLPTLTTWSLLVTPSSGSGYTFTFDPPVQGPSVPDGGTTAAMLGVALSGLGLLRRKLFG